MDWNSHYPAPAKLNLFLHVIGRRADGYHLLQTLFRLIDRGDTLHFSPRDDEQIVLTNPLPGVPADADLTVRAARLLQKEAASSGAHCGGGLGVDITLEKKLPMGGGLGGGSSDAATVLLALNHLWGLHWPRQRLQALALSLGADVPFFIFGRSAFAEGVGEQLQEVQLPPAWYLVLVPNVNVPTQVIFAAPELTRNTNPLKMADFSASTLHFEGSLAGFPASLPPKLLKKSLSFSEMRNDLEAVVASRYPAVAQAIECLQQFTDARMTGSGACVFAPFETENEALKLRERICTEMPNMIAWVSQGIDEHPLYALAGE